jgi:hypothetical protein
MSGGMTKLEIIFFKSAQKKTCAKGVYAFYYCQVMEFTCPLEAVNRPTNFRANDSC